MVRRIEFESPEYWEFFRIRQSELHRPIGLTYSEAERGAERVCLHLVVQGRRSRERGSGPRVQTVRADEEGSSPEGSGDAVVLGGALLSPWSDHALKMRQVAVALDSREQGMGRVLVRAAEEVARELGYEWIVAHARAKVVPFYEKLGYSVRRASFQEVGILHRLVLRRLFV